MTRPGYEAPNFFAVPNAFADDLLSQIDTLSELKVTLAVFRKTFGWHKREDHISLSQLQKATGMGRSAVVEGAKRAEERGSLKKVTTPQGPTVYSIRGWSDERTTSQASASPMSGPPPSPLIGPTKERTERKKETVGGEAPANAAVEIVWTAFEREFPHVTGGLTQSRQRLIERGLREFEPSDLVTAVRGLKAWREKRGGEASLSRIFKTRPGGDAFTDQVQWWMAQAPGSSVGGIAVPSVLRATVHARQLDVQRGHRLPESPQAVEAAEEAEAWLLQHGIETLRTVDGKEPTFRRAHGKAEGSANEATS